MNKIAQNKKIDLDAAYYTKNSYLQNCLAKEILDSLQIDSHAHILDVGCGDGRITVELARRANQGKVLGIDASRNMVEFASKRFPKNNFSNLHFLQKMAEKIEGSHLYDLVVSFSCFHWLKNPRLAIHKLSSSLKKEGEFHILTYPKESPYYKYLEIALKNYPKYASLSANHTMLSTEEYKNLIEEANLEIFDIEQRHLVASYDSFKEVEDYIKGWLNSYVPLPEHLHTSFLKDVTLAMAEEITIKNQKIIIPYTALIIKSKK